MRTQFDTDETLDKSLLALAKAAAVRWDARTKQREGRTKAIAEGRLLDADSPSRLAMRINTLANDLRTASRGRQPPTSPVLRELIDNPVPVTADALTAEIVKEVIINARDFLSIEFLERGTQAARSVGRIVVRTGSGEVARGTGFLVAPGIVLTNEHVLPTLQIAESCAIEMDYEQNRFGTARQPTVFTLEPERLFFKDATLDFALVAVASKGDRGTAIEGYGWLPLTAAQGKIAVTDKDYLNIVQHPMGREKEVVLRDNRVLDLRTQDDAGASDLGPFVHYEGDTEKGSSGSPVFNDQWQVIALHHTGVPKTDTHGNWLNKDGGIWKEGEQPVADIAWQANEGVRVSSLMAAFSLLRGDSAKQPLLDTVLSGATPRPTPDESLVAVANGSVAIAASNPRTEPKTAAPSTMDAQHTGSGSVTIEIPLQITVTLGKSSPGVVLLSQAAGSLLRPGITEERLDPSDYADRNGYDRKFLGVNVPLPTLKARPRFGGILRVTRPARPADKEELRYYRYSVLMCAQRRMAYMSACNVDFAPKATASRDDGTK